MNLSYPTSYIDIGDTVRAALFAGLADPSFLIKENGPV